MHAIGVILLSLSLLSVGLYQRNARNDWLSPSRFWALVCFIMVSIPLLFISFSKVSVLAIAWILLSATCIYSGAATARYSGNNCQKITPEDCRFPGLGVLIIFGSSVGLGALFVQFHMLGHSPIEVFFTAKIFTIMQEIQPLHIQNKIPSIVSGMTGGVYLAAMLGGFYYVAYEKTSLRYLAFLPFVPAISIAYCVTTKLSFLFPVLFWVGSYLAAKVYFRRVITTKTLLWFMAVCVGICLLLALLILARWKSWSPAASGIPFDGLIGFRNYTLTLVIGHIVAFSHWFPTYIQSISEGYGWGRYTFAGIFNFLGYSVRTPAESVVLFPGPYNLSNVYTVFRPLILDFGLFGSLLVFYLAGFLGEYSYSRLKMGQLRWMPVLSIFYWVTMWNFNSSIFNYNSILLASFIFFGYFYTLPYIKKSLPIKEKR
ncbi:O-antigen polymerase [Anaeroselena agilis]|uniref:O-antigen polymerase n=1 Tax=Anaeroselena agilis TaxID=3063788 RepID=A0ABU3P5C3_9FIRM|nr:O-antigen polymerase [Selenomonadales bacterium 4137-cl]